jgi:hypothetical protein
MADSIIFDRSMEAPPDTTSPFVRREVIKLRDIAAAGNYSTSTAEFHTVSLSNGGRWCDYTEAYITIPVVCVVTGKPTANPDGAYVNWTADDVQDSDMLLVMKNSNLNLINSCSIEYGNSKVCQQTDRINDYLIFKQHSEMSIQDEELHGPTIGYAKDSASSWYWSPVNGVCNNRLDYVHSQSTARHSSDANTGMYERAKIFSSVGDTDSSKKHVLGADGEGNDAVVDKQVLKQSNRSYVVNTANHKAYYYNAVVRLKDLPFFASMPSLLKGGDIKIILTLNQCEFKFATGAAMGNMEYAANSFTGKLTNPVMISSDVYTTKMGDVITDRHSMVKRIPSGAYTLPASSTFTVSCNVARPQYSAHMGLGVDDCQVLNCELHVPVYDLKPAIESRYLSMGQKKVVYNETIMTVLNNKAAGSYFNDLLTNGLDHMKRIIMPVISKDGTEVANRNGTAKVDPHLSPFDTVPSTCSPYILENFQVQISNQNVYANPINYSYDHFLQEMNGKYGLESSLVYGASSSRISMRDFVESYGYIVVDLKRKYSSDESVKLSVSISGKVKSARNLDLYCFFEQERTMTIDIATGQRLS